MNSKVIYQTVFIFWELEKKKKWFHAPSFFFFLWVSSFWVLVLRVSKNLFLYCFFGWSRRHNIPVTSLQGVVPTSIQCRSNVHTMSFQRLYNVVPTSVQCRSNVHTMSFQRPYNVVSTSIQCCPNVLMPARLLGLYHDSVRLKSNQSNQLDKMFPPNIALFMLSPLYASLSFVFLFISKKNVLSCFIRIQFIRNLLRKSPKIKDKNKIVHFLLRIFVRM